MGRPKLNRTKEEQIQERRRRKLKHQYQLTPKQYEEMVASQNYQCKLCPEFDRPEKRLVVDHCHTSGKIRGLLCGRCNPALGLVNENIKILERMLAYVRDAGDTI